MGTLVNATLGALLLMGLLSSCGWVQSHGPTPLLQAAADGDVARVAAALDAGADIDSPAMDDWTALTIAAQKGHLDVVRYLIDRGADVNEPEGGGHTALFWAVNYGHDQVAALFRSAGGTYD